MGQPKVSKPKQIIHVLNESITNSISTSLQTAQDDAYISQSLNITCDERVIKIMSKSVNDCRNYLHSIKASPEHISKLCKPIVSCKAANISMQSSLNVTNLCQQISKTKIDIAKNINNHLKQTLDKIQNSILGSVFNKDDDRQTINLQNQEISNLITSVVQEIENTALQSQSMTLQNVSANYITMTSVNSIINKQIQNNKIIQVQVQDIASNISQKIIDNDKNSLTSWTVTIASYILAFVVVIVVIITLLKRRDSRGFVQLVSPYALFIFVTWLIFQTHYLIKPAYVMESGYKSKVNTGKFVFYCSLYSLSFLVLEYVYIKYIRTPSPPRA